MDDSERFCRSQLAKTTGLTVELEDLMQEYELGKLDGRGGPAAVLRLLGESSAEQGKRFQISPESCAADWEEPGESDKDRDEYEEFEREIIDAINADAAGPVYKSLCNDVDYYRADVFKRYFGIQAEKEEAADIAKSLGITHAQVNDIVQRVVQVAKDRLVGRTVSAPLIGEDIQITKGPSRSARKVKRPVDLSGGLLEKCGKVA